jgi:hypothetical protein
MSIGKILSITAFILFSVIMLIAYLKDSGEAPPSPSHFRPIEIELEEEKSPPKEVIRELPVKEVSFEAPVKLPAAPKAKELPEGDRLEELFSTTGSKLPFVETIIYKSRVPWQKGRPAWLSDYASHFGTSRHFIARSLNGKADYFKQDVAEGDRFNVLSQDLGLEFHLVVDIGRCKLWLFALTEKGKTLLKTFPVSLGRKDSAKESGILTPLGKYLLGDKVAIYKPTVMGHYKGQKTEMIRIFGTRWIPFGKEIRDTTAPSKGFGIHGVPWSKNKKGEWEQDETSLGKYESDGCIRLSSDDMETIFAIIISHPAYIELVRDYFDSELVRRCI